MTRSISNENRGVALAQRRRICISAAWRDSRKRKIVSATARCGIMLRRKISAAWRCASANTAAHRSSTSRKQRNGRSIIMHCARHGRRHARHENSEAGIGSRKITERRGANLRAIKREGIAAAKWRSLSASRRINEGDAVNETLARSIIPSANISRKEAKRVGKTNAVLKSGGVTVAPRARAAYSPARMARIKHAHGMAAAWRGGIAVAAQRIERRAATSILDSVPAWRARGVASTHVATCAHRAAAPAQTAATAHASTATARNSAYRQRAARTRGAAPRTITMPARTFCAGTYYTPATALHTANRSAAASTWKAAYRACVGGGVNINIIGIAAAQYEHGNVLRSGNASSYAASSNCRGYHAYCALRAHACDIGVLVAAGTLAQR